MSAMAFDPANNDLVITTRKEIVFIEDNVADIETLIAGIGSGKEVVILDATRDGMHQIAQALAGRSGIDALHIVSHGSEGAVSLGSLMLDAGKLDAYRDDLQAIGRSMSADGDILLYGCDIGAGDGAGFVQQLAIATGADVAASNNVTGAAALGGDWDLEVVSGDVGTAPAIDAQAAALYQNVLNISPGKIEFTGDGTFTSGLDPADVVGPGTDVVFRVNNVGGYELRIDGQNTAISSYTSAPGQLFAGAYAPETEITISFDPGQAFTAQWIALSNWSTVHTDQTLEIRGYDSHYQQVGSTITANLHTSDFTATNISLAGLGGQIVKMLKITATTNGNQIDYLMIDSLTIGTVTPYPPMVSYVDAAQSSGSYKAGSTIDIRVNFDLPVDVTGTPQLTLETGTTDRVANYLSGSGTSQLTFRYTVQAGDTAADLDYKNTAIALNGGTIKLGGQDAILTLPTPGAGGSLSSNRNIVIDTTAPTVAVTSNKSTLKAGETAAITFTFSEDPGASFTWNGSSGDVTVSGGTLSAISGTGLTRTATFTPDAGFNSGTGSITVSNLSYADAAGNLGGGGASPFITYDTVVPGAPSTPVLDPNTDKGVSNSDNVTSWVVLQFTGNAESGVTTVKLFDGATQIGSGAVTTGPYNITTSPLANGVHTITARAYDAAGNESGDSGSVSVTVDTAPPSVTVAADKSVLKAGETATITFTFSEDPGASFSWNGSAGDITVSGGTLSAISGSGLTRTATFTPNANLDGGSAGIQVTAGAYQDPAGNVGTASNNLALTYDTRVPSAPSAPVLAAGDDSGSSNSDGVTKDNTLSFGGSAENGTTVTLYDGATQIGAITASGGAWTIPVSGLTEGNHTLTATATDAAGNTSTSSAGLAVTVDRTPPSTTVAGAKLSDDSGASNSDMITKIAAQTISGTLSANLAAGERVMVSLDNGASWTPATASTGTTAWELAGVTLAGSGTLKVQVVDAAGNGGAVYSHVYVLDQTAPAAPSVPDLDAASDSGASSTDNVTGVTLPGFSGTADVGATVTLFDGGNEIGSVVAVDGTWHIVTSSSMPMNQRIHYITAMATDLAGNAAASAALEVDVRTGGPSTAVASMALSSDTGLAGDFITNTSSQTVSGLLSANLAAGERVQVSLNGGASWVVATAAAGSNAWSLPVTLSAGAHDIKVRVVDAIDNSGPVYTQAYTLDAVKPAVTIASNATQLKAGDTTTVTFTFTEDPGSSFDGSDITVSGGALSAIQGTGLVRTATFTPAANTNGGTASIGIAAGKFQDLAGNDGLAATTLTIAVDTLAPGAPSAPDLDQDSDKGASNTDNLTSLTNLVFKGTAEAGATVRLYDTDGVTQIGSGSADGSGNWTIAASALGAGSHAVTARVLDAAGNLGAASGATSVVIDTAKPTLAITSNTSQLKAGGTATITFTFSEDPGTSFAWDGSSGDIIVSGGTLSAIQGTGLVRTAVFTPTANTNGGTASIAVSAGAYQDAAGNDGNAGATPSLQFDTLAPAAPAAPLLKAASDTGAIGDGVTENSMPVIEGTALANSLVTLYEGAGAGRIKLGTVMSDGTGKWSIATTGLSVGTHALSATQADAAGNESAASPAFTLRIDAPPAPPAPLDLVDGMPVSIQPISLPGGVNGTAISIPVVGAGRLESSGQPGVADIPLATSSQGGNLLLAQVAPGFGLSASGANLPVTNAAGLLLAAIKAATPSHAPADQGHLTGNGHSFLAGLASAGSLLVETVKPVSATAPEGMLTLTGQVPGSGQSTALVIDAAGLASGSTIALQQVNFAAVIGAAKVVAGSGTVLTGDAASQHFTVAAGGSGSVFAGGGNDTLGIGAASGQASSPAAGVTLLHGGAANDVATFGGARADYNIEFHNGHVIVSIKAAPQAKAMVVNVEQLQFSDGSLAIENSADMGLLTGMYQTVLGRQADVMGIDYWAKVHQGGASWGAIALSMIASNEHLADHEGFNGVAAHDVALLYTAIFNRGADAGGLAYWTGLMSHGATLEQVAASFVQSAEIVGHQRAALDWDFSVG